MEIKIKNTTLGQYIEVKMKKGECFYSEPGAIISISGDVEIESNLSGGVVSGMLRMFGGSESAFINKLTAKTNATIQLGPTLAGEIAEVEMHGEELFLGDGTYLCHTGDIHISAKLGGLSSLVAGSGLMFLTAKGTGKLYLAGGESIIKKTLKKGEVFYLDNTAFLACPSNTKLEKVLVGRGLAKLVGGEGFMFKITGPATIYYQTQSPSGLVRYLSKFLPKR